MLHIWPYTCVPPFNIIDTSSNEESHKEQNDTNHVLVQRTLCRDAEKRRAFVSLSLPEDGCFFRRCLPM